MPQPEKDEPKGMTLSTVLDLSERQLIEKLASDDDRTVASMTRILLREALRARGLLPEPAQSAA